MRRRFVVALLAGAVVMAGCGGGEKSGTGTQTPPPTAAVGAPEVPPARPSTKSNAVTIASATAPYARFGTDAAASVFPRTVRHAMGETRIERAAVRVVTLDTGELDTAIELGVKPLGTVDYGADGLPAYFAPKEVEGVEVVGTIQAPNLEAIARLRPDIIPPASSATRRSIPSCPRSPPPCSPSASG